MLLLFFIGVFMLQMEDSGADEEKDDDGGSFLLLVLLLEQQWLHFFLPERLMFVWFGGFWACAMRSCLIC